MYPLSFLNPTALPLLCVRAKSASTMACKRCFHENDRVVPLSVRNRARNTPMFSCFTGMQSRGAVTSVNVVLVAVLAVCARMSASTGSARLAVLSGLVLVLLRRESAVKLPGPVWAA